jgi:hypothetical protein
MRGWRCVLYCALLLAMCFGLGGVMFLIDCVDVVMG